MIYPNTPIYLAEIAAKLFSPEVRMSDGGGKEKFSRMFSDTQLQVYMKNVPIPLEF